MNNNRYPILGKGESYVEEIEKRAPFRTPELPRAYEESKENILKSLGSVKRSIENQDEDFLSEKVICVRMEPKFEAKSYEPVSLFANGEITKVGGRCYTTTKTDSDSQPIKAKLYFAKITDRGIDRLIDTIAEGKRDAEKIWCKQLPTINTIDLLTAKEKIAGFADDWCEGIVEFVLHPTFFDNNYLLNSFLERYFHKSSYKYKSYQNGPTFLSARCTKDELEQIARFNPLRAIHPLGGINFTLRNNGILPDAPSPPATQGKSSTLIGVLDGGADTTIPLLRNFVNATNRYPVSSNDDAVKHGSAVCGAVLYGALNHSGPEIALPVPLVSVESFQVYHPNDDPDDEDENLYDVIDRIEEIVTSHPDIRVYNLSLGPDEPILDDDIHRFTYSLDELSAGVQTPLFCVASGNSGHKTPPLDRIQSPSDLVNGIGVGAYSYNYDNKKIRAHYSCVGPGREGSKVKPDIVEFGGCDSRPILLVSTEQGKLASHSGTSFAAPIVAGKIGKILAQSDDVTPHMARTLLIHNATRQKDDDPKEIGYGFCPEDVDGIINCSDNRVVILYEGAVFPKQYIKLPVLMPNTTGLPQNIRTSITMTITTLAKTNPSDVDSYTTNCIEETFYPHCNKYNYTLNKKTITALADTSQEIELIQQGYKKSTFPATKPAKQYASESELRVNHLKWDTVVKKEYGSFLSSLHEPFFILHGMTRFTSDTWSLRYYAAITLNIPKYPSSRILYDDIRSKYRQLAPIRIREHNQILVSYNN